MDQLLTTSPSLAWDLKIQPWSLVTLNIHTSDLPSFQQQLALKFAGAPSFLKNTPVVLCFHPLERIITADHLAPLLELLAEYGLRIVGCYGSDPWILPLCELFALPYLSKKDTKQLSLAHEAKHFIKSPLRAGQQFFSTQDVIALAPIHAGAEVLSTGSIHAYGETKGRLMAGIEGQRDSMIFCRSLDAELISIAGVFMTKNMIHPSYLKAPCMVSLEHDELRITLMPKE